MLAQINPVAVFPLTATQLEVDPSWAFSGTPRFNYRLNAVGTDGTTKTLVDQVVYMTSNQWNTWSGGVDNDEQYILSCVAENLGLEIVPDA